MQPSESLVFDTGVLVEHTKGTGRARRLNQRLKEGTLAAHTTDLNLFELSYLICREVGWQRASSVVGALRESGYLAVHDVQPIWRPRPGSSADGPSPSWTA